MNGVCRLFAAISPTTAVPSIPSRPAKPYSFHSFTGIKLSKGGACYLTMPWRAGTLKEAMEVEIETDNVADMAEVNGLPDLETKLEGKEEEEIMEDLHSHGEYFGRKKRKAVDLDVNNYDRFKMNNGREVFEEKAYLVGVESKDTEADNFGIEESLKELAQLADTAGLLVVGMTHQKEGVHMRWWKIVHVVVALIDRGEEFGVVWLLLDKDEGVREGLLRASEGDEGRLAAPNPKTYIGSGKVAEIKSAVHALDVETVIFDDELSAGQLRNLEKAFGGDIRVCDRTSLILDIFNQRAATHEAALQAALLFQQF
ncbi:hypothetical protein IEQ34_019560 [Dendrobium chrysotoxum]|uniref:GTPase HflX N-terminal domain-containing protein n=1 Tax=Dendrobium chrysotoxum TaxID=161865 RepID=A0AAV7G7C6_DENCH|nr:hypothetical protein IEQ34_019560 [Dendrobium chrysotoxum]